MPFDNDDAMFNPPAPSRLSHYEIPLVSYQEPSPLPVDHVPSTPSNVGATAHPPCSILIHHMCLEYSAQTKITNEKSHYTPRRRYPPPIPRMQNWSRKRSASFSGSRIVETRGFEKATHHQGPSTLESFAVILLTQCCMCRNFTRNPLPLRS